MGKLDECEQEEKHSQGLYCNLFHFVGLEGWDMQVADGEAQHETMKLGALREKSAQTLNI